MPYVVLSALFFAFAIMSKPNAFVDAAMFFLLLLGIGIGTLAIVGGIAVIVAVLAKFGLGTIQNYIDPLQSKYRLIGAVLLFPQTMRTYLVDKARRFQQHLTVLKYGFVW